MFQTGVVCLHKELLLCTRRPFPLLQQSENADARQEEVVLRGRRSLTNGHLAASLCCFVLQEFSKKAKSERSQVTPVCSGHFFQLTFQTAL